MDRRTFLGSSIGSLGLVGLVPSLGCASGRRRVHHDFDPGVVHLGSERLIFGPDGRVFALDPTGHQLFARDMEGAGQAVAASFGTEPGELNGPVDAVVGPDGRIFVLEKGNSRVQVFSSAGVGVAIIGHAGSGPTGLFHPRALALRGDELFVSDTLHHRVQVYALDGTHRRSLGGERTDGRPRLNGPRGLAHVPNGDLHVVDSGNARVQVYTAQGEPRLAYGTYGMDGSGAGRMLHPHSIVATAAGPLLVTDPSAGLVHAFEPGGRFLGSFVPRDADDGPQVPVCISLSTDGTPYIWTAGHAAHPKRNRA